jgi:hypothetical protein
MSHLSGSTNSTGHSHKNTIEHFANAVNSNHFNDLNKYLDEHVQKTVDSEVVYRNLKEAQDYYKNNRISHWKIIHFNDNDQKGNTIEAKLTHNNKTYNTKYTFSASGKIQHIDSTLDNNSNPTVNPQ